MAPPPSIHDHFSRKKAGNMSKFVCESFWTNSNRPLQWPHIFENYCWAIRDTIRKMFHSYSIQMLIVYDKSFNRNTDIVALIWSNHWAKVTFQALQIRNHKTKTTFIDYCNYILIFIQCNWFWFRCYGTATALCLAYAELSVDFTKLKMCFTKINLNLPTISYKNNLEEFILFEFKIPLTRIYYSYELMAKFIFFQRIVIFMRQNLM